MTHPPPKERHFVGRKDELTQFRQLLADTAGRAILITGQQGMGKSTLARRLLEEAARPPLICGSVTYEVTATDPPEAIMERMVEEGWAASQVAGSFSADPHRRRQWKAIFQTLPTGTKLLTLIAALRRPSKRSAREQLTHALARLSDGLPEHHRVLFFIDSEKRMSEGSEDPWCLLVRQLPPKILLLFAQRPDDALASSPAFSRLPNVARLPETELSPFTPDEIDDLLRPWASGLPYTRDQLRAHFARLEGHPYTAAAALDLLLDEEVQLDQLPTDRDGIAAEQRRRILRRGADASRLFSAHAVLEVPVPDDLVREVAQLDSHAHVTLLADPYVHGLLLTPKPTNPPRRPAADASTTGSSSTPFAPPFPKMSSKPSTAKPSPPTASASKPANPPTLFQLYASPSTSSPQREPKLSPNPWPPELLDISASSAFGRKPKVSSFERWLSCAKRLHSESSS